MIKNITLGQYIPTESFVHNADPRTKINLTLLYIISVFLIKNPIFYGIVALYLYFTIYFSKIPASLFLKGLRPIRIILIITFVLNLFFASTGNIIFKLFFIQITDQGLYMAVHFSLRLVFMVLGASVLTLTTSPIAISDGIEQLLKPLKKIHFPVHELAMMMTIALRFIPTLLEEADKIMKAQISRGADFESGNLIQRAKAMLPLLVPLFISAFRRANELAMAMEARCYHGDDNRTRYRLLQYTKLDAIAYIFSFVYFVIVLLVFIFV